MKKIRESLNSLRHIVYNEVVYWHIKINLRQKQEVPFLHLHIFLIHIHCAEGKHIHLNLFHSSTSYFRIWRASTVCQTLKLCYWFLLLLFIIIKLKAPLKSAGWALEFNCLIKTKSNTSIVLSLYTCKLIVHIYNSFAIMQDIIHKQKSFIINV